jgi:pimeloyl-ACP methyl ester carboxylesterase
MARRAAQTALSTLLFGGLLAFGGLAAFRASSAAAALRFSPCDSSPGFECAGLAVPLDRSGAVRGAITLEVQRQAAPLQPASSAVVALAGGPGQAALPLAPFMARAMAPALAARDLLVFDQRGTGTSAPLTCGAFSGAPANPVGQLVERCALQIGPKRGDFTTAESVADIESLRQAAGYQRLVLYGTSYGTKVALQYAARYPSHTEALVLDSVVPPNGPEPLDLATFQAIPGALAELCSQNACAGITADPLGDIARLAARMRAHPLRGVAYDGRGHRSRSSVSESDLLEILQAGDLNPALRALLPAAVRSALRGDPGPLVRLHLLSLGLIPTVPKVPVENSPPVDEALFAATSCEETPFPWRREAASATRLVEADAAAGALPSATFYPFDAPTALSADLIPICAYWPDASPAPAPTGALPDVPTLILSGAQDLRTPTALASQVAAQIPGSQLEVVPYTGHSVLGSDFSGCAAAAVSAFFSGAPVRVCTSATNVFAPTPISPTKLAYLSAPPGLRGRPGRTLTAVLDTLVDLSRQVISATLQADQELPSGSSFGGLRGGYATLTPGSVRLRRYSFVSGVALSGTFPVSGGQLQPATIAIGGRVASHGRVRFTLHRYVTGTLGGHRFHVSLASVKLSRARDSAFDEAPWPIRVSTRPLPAAGERVLLHQP